jgi:uncharacterized membrane protein
MLMASIEHWRDRCRTGLSIFYAVAGVLHICIPGPFLSVTPSWVPDAPQVILLTGICEIAGAIGLFFPTLRRAAGIALALYAICVFPANIKHAIDSLSASAVSPSQWLYHALRLPMQPLIVWLALFAGKAINWPFKKETKV